MSLGPGCAEEGEKLLPVLHAHLPVVMQAAPVALPGLYQVSLLLGMNLQLTARCQCKRARAKMVPFLGVASQKGNT